MEGSRVVLSKFEGKSEAEGLSGREGSRGSTARGMGVCTCMLEQHPSHALHITTKGTSTAADIAGSILATNPARYHYTMQIPGLDDNAVVLRFRSRSKMSLRNCSHDCVES